MYAFEPPPAELAEEPAVFEIPEFVEPAAEVQVFEPAALAVALPQEEPAAIEVPESTEPAGVVEVFEPSEAEPAPLQGLVYRANFGATPSSLAGMGVVPVAEPLAAQNPPEIPAARIPLAFDPPSEPVEVLETDEVESFDLLPAFADLPDADAPIEVFSFADEIPASVPAAQAPEPPPLWVQPEPAAPIEISSIRPEPLPQPVLPASDLELPTGMHDLSTWSRLLALTSPMTGILFTITLTKAESAPGEAGKKAPVDLPDLTRELDRLMGSFVKDRDFGAKIGENEWVFVYKADATGFNQRRVGGISEKLWDFQLRHLGMSSVSFKWGAVEVEKENLPDALAAARERMNQSPRRARKLPGADTPQPRRVVNA
ncbi:MAG: hypothetical protein FJW30_24630 [Acidobacteria bacterium]|nr:hypothetical protein [Acidobacteriota bacterium]